VCYILVFISIVVVSGDPCPDTLPDLCPNCTAYHDEMGCVYADPSEEDRYDNYQDALDHCKDLMGNKSVLAEALTEDQQNVLVGIMRVSNQGSLS